MRGSEMQWTEKGVTLILSLHKNLISEYQLSKLKAGLTVTVYKKSSMSSLRKQSNTSLTDTDSE